MTKRTSGRKKYVRKMRMCAGIYIEAGKEREIGNEVYGRHFRTIKRDSTLYKWEARIAVMSG